MQERRLFVPFRTRPRGPWGLLAKDPGLPWTIAWTRPFLARGGKDRTKDDTGISGNNRLHMCSVSSENAWYGLQAYRLRIGIALTLQQAKTIAVS